MSIRNLLPFLIFIAIVLILWLGLGKDPNILPSVLLNKPMPILSAPQLNENLAEVNTQTFQNKVTLLNVWASWCDSCRFEHPILLDIARENNLQIVGLNYKDERNQAKKFLQKLGNPFKAIIYDPNGKIGMQLGVYGTPETFIIDNKGIVRFKYIGPVTLDTWKNVLSPQIQRISRGE